MGVLYFMAPDADGEPTIWSGAPNDPSPQPVVRRHDLRDAPDLWAALCALIGDHVQLIALAEQEPTP